MVSVGGRCATDKRTNQTRMENKMATVYLLSDKNGVPFGAFSSTKAVSEYVEANWKLNVGTHSIQRQEKSDELFDDEKYRSTRWATRDDMYSDEEPYVVNGAKLEYASAEEIAKGFRGSKSTTKIIQDSTGCFRWVIVQMPVVASTRKK